MKIYLNQNDNRLGPFSSEQLQEKIYSGEIDRSTPACVEGQDGWHPVESLLAEQRISKVAPEAPPVMTMTLEKLRDPNERTALICLYIAAVPGLLLAILVFFPFLIVAILALPVILIGQLLFSAHIRTNAVRVSPRQLPELYDVVKSCCERLNMEQPEVYVMQQNVWNAFAAKIVGRRMVVLLSGAVDSILLKGNLRQLSWVVGHELGHHYAGHLDFVRKLANFGDWCIWVRLWYSRRRELTCDRIGLYCAGDLASAQLALINATVGAQLASKVSMPEAIEQWRRHQNEFFVRYRTLYATYPHLLARLDHLTQAATEFGLA